jgi:hypothetical protein
MWWLIVGGALALIAALVVGPALVQALMKPKLVKRVAEVYSDDQILLRDFKALGFGLQSRGVTQLRGNGALVLTADSLHFFQFTPASDYRMALDTLTEAKTVRSHLGKSIGRNLLHAEFTIDGASDSMAWYVGDVEAWLDQLRKARSLEGE